MVASTINETNELASSKSFFLNVKLNTTNQNISPMVDLDRKSIIAIGNRLNKVDIATDITVDPAPINAVADALTFTS